MREGGAGSGLDIQRASDSVLHQIVLDMCQTKGMPLLWRAFGAEHMYMTVILRGARVDNIMTIVIIVIIVFVIIVFVMIVIAIVIVSIIIIVIVIGGTGVYKINGVVIVVICCHSMGCSTTNNNKNTVFFCKHRYCRAACTNVFARGALNHLLFLVQ